MTRPAAPSWLPGSAGALAFLATSIGLSGTGDTPDPHDSASSTVANFAGHRPDIILGAAIGLVGALAMPVATLLLARPAAAGRP